MLPNGMSRDRFEQTAERLVELGWAFKATDPNGGGTTIAPWVPPEIEQRLADELVSTFSRVDQGPWLMRSFLDLAVFDDDYIDGASPPWLVDCFPDGPYVLGRWYRRASIAFTFQPKKYDRRAIFAAHSETAEHWGIIRDYIAAGLCAHQQVLLIKIQPPDLSYEGMVRKVRGLLPIRPFKAGGPIDKTMTKLTERYLQSLEDDKGRL